MQLRWGRWLANEKGVRILWKVTGALLLGVLLARWSWILFAPHATATASISGQVVSVEAARLFGVAVVAAPAASAIEVAALPNVQLAGLFAANAGKTSFAVLIVDGKQLGVALGDEVSNGLKLVEVHADHVILERAGVQHRVNLDTETAAAKQLK